MTKLRMSWPNRITLGRILLTGPFVIAMLNINEPAYKPWARYGALAIFMVMALSDALDGYLARRKKSITLLGTFLDPLADKLLITCSCLLLASKNTAVEGMALPGWVVVIIIGKDIYITLGFIVIYLVTSEMKIVPVKAGKACTALQLSMVIAVLIWPEMGRLLPSFKYLIYFLWILVTVLAIVTVLIYTRNGTQYLNEFEQRLLAGRNNKNHADHNYSSEDRERSVNDS